MQKAAGCGTTHGLKELDGRQRNLLYTVQAVGHKLPTAHQMLTRTPRHTPDGSQGAKKKE